MFCGECGTQNPDTKQFCKNCGKPLRKTRQSPAPQPAGVSVPPGVSTPPAVPAYNPLPVTGGQVPATAPAQTPEKQPADRGMLALGIIGLVFSTVSWFRYPYICVILSVILGGIVLLKSKNKTGIAAIIAILAILTGVACIVVDVFYFTIFPTPYVDL